MAYRSSICSGSGELKKNPCETCQNDGKNTTAVKYCTDCFEYQCGPCSKHHLNYKAFRHHVIKDVEAVKPGINKDSTKMIDKSTDRLANLDITFEHVQPRPRDVTSSSGAIRNVTANLVTTIDSSASNDNTLSHIYDVTAVQTHYCVVTDMGNESVKVVDTGTRRVTSQIQLSDADRVFSITSVNDDQVAVSANIKGVSKILLFSVSASGIICDTPKSIVMICSAYNGITHSNDRFYAAVSAWIDVISMQGQIITTFNDKSFSGLRGIAFSNDNNTLYVCSSGNDKVFSVDLNGNLTASYKDNDLKKPEGITVDSYGYVYVCSGDTKCVHQLTADLSKVKVIITDVDVLRCVFNMKANSLNLGKGEEIKVYNLNYL